VVETTLTEKRELIEALERGSMKPRPHELRTLEIGLHTAVSTARDMWASSRSHAFTPSPATVRGGSRCHWTTSPPSNTDVARFAWPGGVRQEPEAESIVPGLTQAELAEALDGLSQLGMIEGEPVPGQGARPDAAAATATAC
jgi:hypothetical protein